MTNMIGRKLSIFSHPGKKTVIGLLQDHFNIEAHIGPGQYGPRLRLRPIWVSLFQMSEVCNKQFNTLAFPYWSGYHPSTHIGPRRSRAILVWLSSLDPYWPETESRTNMGRGMITRPIWKCPCINLYKLYESVFY